MTTISLPELRDGSLIACSEILVSSLPLISADFSSFIVNRP